ncbi:MAG: 50S ribosomal protein L35 [Candidatus Omnitrophota bacterium]
MKLKTHKGTAKRFKVTKSGKLKYKPSGKGHLLTVKTRKRKRLLRKSRTVDSSGQKANIKQLLPYSR